MELVQTVRSRPSLVWSDNVRPNLGHGRMGVPGIGRTWRLNTFALLTAVALFIVMARRSQFDDDTTRDTIASLGLFGFMLAQLPL